MNPQQAGGDKRSRRRKRRKRRRSHRRGSSSDSSTHSSSSDASDFHFPTSRNAGRENAIQELARRKPGKLFRQGLGQMQKLVEPTAGGTVGEQLQPAAYKYLTTLVQVGSSMQLSRRDRSELKTLATGLDHLARGNLAPLGDLLMQRFKAVEGPVKNKSWEISKNYELVDDELASTAARREKEVAARMTVRNAQLAAALGSKQAARGFGG